MMTIQTPQLYGRQTPVRMPWLPRAITVALCVPLFWRRRRKMQGLLLCALLSAAAALTGCGGGLGRPPATYTLTGTSGTDFHSTTLKLTIQ